MTPSGRSALRDYYAARAPEYDRVYEKAERQNDLRALERWVAEQFAGAHVLEIACGTGYWTRFIAEAAASVRAEDLTPQTLSIARNRVARAHVRFTIGDAYAPVRGTDTFDAAFGGFWLSHVPIEQRHDFLRSLNATLESGARVVFVDNRFVADSSSEIAGRDAAGNTYQLRRLADGTVHRVLKNFPSPAELLSLGQWAGRDPQLIQWQYYWAMRYVNR